MYSTLWPYNSAWSRSTRCRIARLGEGVKYFTMRSVSDNNHYVHLAALGCWWKGGRGGNGQLYGECVRCESG